jgi:hypothetical protein
MKKCFVFLMLASLTANAATPDFKSPYFAVGFDRHSPEFFFFALDGLGQGKLSDNPVLPTGQTNLALKFF